MVAFTLVSLLIIYDHYISFLVIICSWGLVILNQIYQFNPVSECSGYILNLMNE